MLFSCPVRKQVFKLFCGYAFKLRNDGLLQLAVTAKVLPLPKQFVEDGFNSGSGTFLQHGIDEIFPKGFFLLLPLLFFTLFLGHFLLTSTFTFREAGGALSRISLQNSTSWAVES